MSDTSLHPNAARVQDALLRAGAPGTVRQLAESTATSGDAALALGVEVAQIGKSLVFLGDDRAVVIVLSGADRLDTAALAAFLGATKVRRPDDFEVIWVAAGTPNAVFPTTYEELIRIAPARSGRFRA